MPNGKVSLPVTDSKNSTITIRAAVQLVYHSHTGPTGLRLNIAHLAGAQDTTAAL